MELIQLPPIPDQTGLLVFAYFITWTIITGSTICLYIWPQIWHCFICSPDVFRRFLIVSYSDNLKPFLQRIFTNGPEMLENIHTCGAPRWMVYFTSWTLTSSLLSQNSLDPHRKGKHPSNTSLVYTSPGLWRIPLIWITIYGIPRTLCLNINVSY